MRQMKDSGIEWIGQIPQEWNILTFQQATERMATGLNPRDNFVLTADDEVFYVTIKNFKNGKLFLDENCDKISVEAFNLIQQRSQLQKGDILFASISEEGNAYIIDEDPKNWNINESVFVIRPNLNRMTTKYFYYHLTDVGYYSDLRNDATGATFQSIKQNKLRKSRMVMPPLAEQIRITDFLDVKCAEIDDLIAAKEKTNTLLKEHRQSIIYEAVTKGLNPDAPMKDSGIEWIGMIPAHWSVGKLGYFIDVFNGDRSSNYPSGNDIQESGVPFLTSSNLEFDVLDMSDSKYISEEKYASMSGLKMELDDIIYCLRGSVGKCSINKTETCGTVASSLMGIRCKKMVPDYLLFVLKSAVIETQNALFMNGTCAANLSAENVCGYLVPIPSEAEQREIATHLQGRCVEMDALISANESTIQKLKEYRQSIIYEAVTGKIEV